MPPLARVAIPDVGQRGYRAYPLVDHIADKIASMFQRYGSDQHSSTRYRDLASIIGGATVEAHAQTIALRSEEQRRQITLPDRFDVPDRAFWEAGYAREAGRSLLSYAKTLEEALAAVRLFIDALRRELDAVSWTRRCATCRAARTPARRLH